MCRVVLASKKLWQSWAGNLLRQRFLVHSQEEKRSRHKRCAFVERQRKSQKILERKVDLAVRGEREAQQKNDQAEADVEARNWEKKNSDFACQEINQQCESPRFQPHQASRWADQAQRD